MLALTGLSTKAPFKLSKASAALTEKCFLSVSLQVQRDWMYLENLFLGSNDVQKQLPKEAELFQGAHEVFCSITAAMQATPNALEVYAAIAPCVITSLCSASCES